MTLIHRSIITRCKIITRLSSKTPRSIKVHPSTITHLGIYEHRGKTLLLIKHRGHLILHRIRFLQPRTFAPSMGRTALITLRSVLRSNVKEIKINWIPQMVPTTCLALTPLQLSQKTQSSHQRRPSYTATTYLQTTRQRQGNYRPVTEQLIHVLLKYCWTTEQTQFS